MIALKFPRWTRRLAPLAVLMVLAAACSTAVSGESWAGVSTDGTSIFLAYQDKLFRLDATNPTSTGANRWGYQIPGNAHSYQPPALSDTALYVGGYDGKLYGFDKTTGQPLPGWTPFNTGDKIIGGVTYDKGNDLVYSPTGSKGVGAFDPKTGAEVAHFDNMAFAVWGAPLVVGNVVYAASFDHNLYVLDSKTLALKWKLDLGGAVGDSPAYDGKGTLYIGTFNSEVLSIDVSSGTSGKIINRFKASNWVWGSPVLDNGTLYFGDLNGNLYALDAGSFKVLWQAQDKVNPGGIRGRVAVVDNVAVQSAPNVKRLVLAGNESKHLYAYDADTGNRVWVSAITFNDRILNNLIVVGPNVVFTTVSEDQILVAYNIQTGQIAFQTKLSDLIATLIPTPHP